MPKSYVRRGKKERNSEALSSPTGPLSLLTTEPNEVCVISLHV